MKCITVQAEKASFPKPENSALKYSQFLSLSV